MRDFHVRPAVATDAEAIVRAHHEAHGRQRVGTAIVNRLEQIARERAVERLNLDASINAEAFYARHGYHVVERTMLRFRSGHEMACVTMTKPLSQME